MLYPLAIVAAGLAVFAIVAVDLVVVICVVVFPNCWRLRYCCCFVFVEMIVYAVIVLALLARNVC